MLRYGLVIVLCLASCRHEEAPASTTPEEIVVPVAARPAEVGSVRAVLHASGITTPAPSAEFLALAPEPARIVEITKGEGEAVAAGELLVRLEIPSANADAARQRAETARLRADLENARVNQARARDFAERGFIARRELEDADRALADAQAALARAEAAQNAADAALARTLIRAPFSGVVARRLRNPGDVTSGAATDPILRVVDPAGSRCSPRCPPAISRGCFREPRRAWRVSRAAGTVRLTVSSRPGAAAATLGGTVPVRLTPAEPVSLAVDSPVQVDIDLEEHANAVLVAPEAIVRDGGTTAVFVVAGNRAERREVTTGVIDERYVEITSGIRAGELIITRGQAGLEDGAAISVDITAR